MQLRVWHVVRSVLANWFTTVATLAVGFFLAPFVVHHLGNVAYGVWVLAVSSVNYLSLLDLGMASSVVRFVSKGHATGNHDESSDALSAVIWVRVQIAAVVFLLSCALAIVFPYFFKVPPSLATEAREAILLIGVSSTSYMLLGCFSSVLSALNRYDLRGVASLVQLVLRVVGVVTLLSAGYGIVAVAISECVATLIGNGLLYVMVRKVYPELKIRIRKPDRSMLRKIWSYSAYAFLLTVATQLVYQSDNLVVGAFVSATAVTFYSIGNSLCRYTQQFVGAMSTTFVPTASALEAGGNVSGLRSLYYNGTRAAMAVSLPIVLTFLTRGHNFIAVWMGPQYSQTSGMVLMILATALLFNLQNSPTSAIAWGVEKHKVVAKWALPEAVANFTLSIILARVIGIYGVAIGTLIPNLVTAQILYPRFASKLIGITYREVVFRVWGPVYLCSIPFAAASYAVARFYPAHSMVMFFVQTLALLPIFGICVSFFFRDAIKRVLLPRVKSFLYA